MPGDTWGPDQARALAEEYRERNRLIIVAKEPTHPYTPGPFGQCPRMVSDDGDTFRFCRAPADDPIHREGNR